MVQVNIKIAQCWYVLKPFVNAFLSALIGIVDTAYETQEYSISVDAKHLRKSLSVLGLGCDSSKDKRIEFHVHQDHVLICDEGAQNRTEQNRTEQESAVLLK